MTDYIFMISFLCHYKRLKKIRNRAKMTKRYKRVAKLDENILKCFQNKTYQLPPLLITTAVVASPGPRLSLAKNELRLNVCPFPDFLPFFPFPVNIF